MTIVVEATYEDGVLKPNQPLPLHERQRVRVVIQGGMSRARESAGLMGWKGDGDLADRFAMDPELAFPAPAPWGHPWRS